MIIFIMSGHCNDVHYDNCEITDYLTTEATSVKVTDKETMAPLLSLGAISATYSGQACNRIL